jgi:hypothetical protein
MPSETNANSLESNTEIRFIKLGDRGVWEKSCIEDNTIRLGYESPLHEESLSGNWDAVRSFWLNFRNGDQRVASSDVNQIRDFYELSESVIWVTFFNRRMYWCRAAREVIQLEDGTRIRRATSKWSCYDLHGSPLTIENIDGRVTKVRGYRGTICKVELDSYLIRKLNGEAQPEVEAARASLGRLRTDIEELIRGLWWNDFELLVELIFSKSGWQRMSVLGKTEKDIDIDMLSPVTQERAFVQVKSSTNAAEISGYYDKFKDYTQYHEMYFVFHTFNGQPKDVPADVERLHVWDTSRVADLVIHAGLVDWLITKRS